MSGGDETPSCKVSCSTSHEHMNTIESERDARVHGQSCFDA